MKLAKLCDDNNDNTTNNNNNDDSNNTETQLSTGILREREVEPLVSALTKYKTYEQSMRFIREGLQWCLQSGLTCVQTNDERCFAIYSQLQREHLLPIRVSLTAGFQELDSFQSPIHMFNKNNTNSNTNSNSNNSNNMIDCQQKLSVDRVKIFCDGSLGANTAAILLKPEELQLDNVCSLYLLFWISSIMFVRCLFDVLQTQL